MSGTKELNPPPTEALDPIGVGETESLTPNPNADLHRRAAARVTPVVLRADDEARARAAVKATLPSEYARSSAVSPLPIDEATRARMLTLLDSFPVTAERIELEVIIRGGKRVPVQPNDRVISPVAYTLDKK